MTISADFSRPDQIGRGIFLTIFCVLVFGVQDALFKLLVQEYSPFQVAMMRYWGFALFALWLVSRQAPLSKAFQSKTPKWQIARGVFLIADIWCFAFGLISVGIAEAQAIASIYPLLVTLIAIPVLGEKVGPFRFIAVGAGLIGTLIIVRPGMVPMDMGTIFLLASAALYAVYIVITRKVTRVDSASTSMLYTAVVGLVLSSAVGVFFWQPMGWGHLAIIITIMGTTIAGHGLMTYALKLAPASVIQPFNYLAIPWAICIGYFAFGEHIDPLTLVGAAVVVGAGLVVMARESMKRS
jgi:drug/metabolite transporter (DMT)-like permease